MGKFQQFFAPSSSQNSFLRWTVDLDHTYSLYGNTRTMPGNTDTIGPDSCAPAGENCPGISRTRNFNGSIDVRLLLSESITSATSAVPFYFQPTLGGSDINGGLALGIRITGFEHPMFCFYRRALNTRSGVPLV